MSELTIHKVSKELARPREQMNTHQAKYEGALDRFRADMAQKDTALERLRTDMAKNQGAFDRFRADTAQREINRMRWLIGVWVGGVLVTIAILGILIRLSI